ncbi:methyl-accepting chemotaxis protein [Aurantimonas sp. C2-6-R+9]|uniref:methyl-accepting chemotaxis protein n=1 Tax=unclassified Aurantimonas TaxID=2638230 RepID=UPI002E18B847|nr:MULTISPECIES: methyl-accepting chemotaxis protein [unclassified Aurantimonas]MEC5289573.1 methyl-accepting chemotaxis protein [Aurantimonas sp. C2-3-R2]MEC5379538.1 methyl-accepting chemotaxis protein [Aurantimonas sp. C2-6-R+9]MEC5410654.1 methyl-accepting chemotaxis protein [Aurantimonas sp. C2-4-R8]
MSLRNIKFSTRIIAAVFLPLLALSVYEAIQVNTLWRESKAAQQTEMFAREMRTVYDLVHVLQVERGNSAGFIGSKGAQMGDSLAKARGATDQRIADLRSVGEALGPVGNAEITKSLANAGDALQRVQAVRGTIDSFAISTGDALGYYTGAIADLSRIGSGIVKATENRDTAMNLAAYVNIMGAKELAGVERGMGAGGIAAGTFSLAAFDAFSAKKGAQEALISRFFDLASEDVAATSRSLYGKGASADVEAMRLVILDGGNYGKLSSLNAGTWFAGMTEWLGTLGSMGAAVSDRIIADAAAASSAAQTQLTVVAAIALGLFAAIALSIVLVVRSIVRPISGLSVLLRRMANGEFDIEVPFAGQRTEVGAMAGSVVALREALREKSAQDAELEAGRHASDSARQAADAKRATAESERLAVVVGELGSGLRELASGNLCHRIDTAFSGEFEQLRTDFNEAVAQLDATLAAVGSSARAVHVGADEIRGAADNMAGRTEQQAASVEETSAAFQEINTAVQGLSAKAKEAGDLTSRAKGQAERSGEVVRNAVTAMGRIETSSREIGNIIGVIDEIAFQTNLLALNAGVEAARVGAAGKGFAVVAQEVRELAQRSTEAAKQIKELVASSQDEVGSGVALVGETGNALEAIVAEIREIDAHVAAIATTAREQSVGLQEINTALHSIDQGTQQNAAVAEQSTAASHGLATEASSLNDLLSRFKLAEQSLPGRARRAA